MNEIKWSNMINLNEFFKNNKIVNYDDNSDSDSCDVEENKFDIEEYNKIDINNYNSLNILKLQNKVSDCCNIIIQNNDDLKVLVEWGVLNSFKTKLLRGSGVKIENFINLDEPEGITTVCFAARFLRDKGIY